MVQAASLPRSSVRCQADLTYMDLRRRVTVSWEILPRRSCEEITRIIKGMQLSVG